MLPIYIVVALAVGLAIVVLLYVGAGTVAGSHWGRLALLVGVVALPLLLSAGSVSYGVRKSTETTFCLSCHEMQPYGGSLFADNRAALSAVHYQKRLIDRDTTCYSCHADYAMFGDVKAKVNGLRHVWAHYFGHIPDKIALYQKYPSANCLHCHDDARGFLEAPAHQPVLDAVYKGKVSCLACHNLAHDLKALEAHKLWQAK
ncbi:MAG: NapC/NirT family cytochrome c [Deltaproteobacteria bacterium]|nr:NapC/NirT family cytochrome c [Deltaproteobacteria bacterium]